MDLDLADRLLAPATAVGGALLEPLENQWYERKSARVAAATLAHVLIAFANAEGGTVVVGLGNGAVEGISRHGHRVNAWRQAGIDHCEPPVRVTWTEVTCLRADGTHDRLLVGAVPPSQVVHATKSDDVYLRVGDENRRLTFVQRQELIYDKGQASFDGSPVAKTAISELNPELVRAYADAIGSAEPSRALVARGLMLKSGEVTVAGWLLFAPEPQTRHPSAYVRVVRYAGTARETGARQRVIEDIRCEGSIPVLLDAARRAVDRLQPHRRLLGPEGRFVLQGLIPDDAWLEAIVNAVVHRSYSLGGDHIRVEIFDDRIEVESPGTFPGLARPVDLPHMTRFARNPRIARVCADLEFGQELGEGIRRIYEEMRSRGLADPLFTETRGTVRVVLSSLVTDGRILGQFRPEYLRVMDLIRSGQRLSTGDVAQALGSSRPTAKARLRALQSLGFIEWVGKSPQDPRAYWRLRSE